MAPGDVLSLSPTWSSQRRERQETPRVVFSNAALSGYIWKRCQHCRNHSTRRGPRSRTSGIIFWQCSFLRRKKKGLYWVVPDTLRIKVILRTGGISTARPQPAYIAHEWLRHAGGMSLLQNSPSKEIKRKSALQLAAIVDNLGGEKTHSTIVRNDELVPLKAPHLTHILEQDIPTWKEKSK